MLWRVVAWSLLLLRWVIDWSLLLLLLRWIIARSLLLLEWVIARRSEATLPVILRLLRALR